MSSQVWDSWNLPMLLLGPGSLILMNMAFLMVLVVFVCLHAHCGELVHTDAMPRHVTMVIDGGRSSEMFFQPFPKNPCRLPYVFLLTIHPVTLMHADYPTLLSDIIPVLGSHQEVFDGVAFFKIDLEPHLTANNFKAVIKPLVYRSTMQMLLLLLLGGWVVGMVVLGLFYLCLQLQLVQSLFKAQVGYLHLCRALLIYFISL